MFFFFSVRTEGMSILPTGFKRSFYFFASSAWVEKKTSKNHPYIFLWMLSFVIHSSRRTAPHSFFLPMFISPNPLLPMPHLHLFLSFPLLAHLSSLILVVLSIFAQTVAQLSKWIKECRWQCRGGGKVQTHGRASPRYGVQKGTSRRTAFFLSLCL